MGRKYRLIGLLAGVGLLLAALVVWIRRPREFANDELVQQAVRAGAASSLAEELPGAWPQWRGPRRDGQVDGASARSLEGGKPVPQWEIPLGEGYSSPVVVDGRVITLSRSGDEEELQALDARDGTRVWRHAWPTGYANDFGRGPRATPTVAAGMVFALGAAGRMEAVSLSDGKPAWHVDLVGEWATAPPRWGFSGSPLVVGDLVVVQAGPPAGVVAFHRLTGKEVWRATADPAGYSSPLLVRCRDGLQLVCLTGLRVLGMDPGTGEVLWQQEWPTEFEVNAATPLVWTVPKADGETLYAFVTSGYGRGCCLIRTDKETGGKFWNASVVYRKTRLRSQFGSPVRMGDWICGYDEQMVTALDWRTGEKRWSQRGFKKGTVLGAGDHLLLLGEEGDLALAKPGEKDLREVWRLKVFGDRGPAGKKAWTMPVVAEGVVLVRDEEKLACLKLAVVKD
ncbi:MAG: PQQ-binding-like beta-propeller repeat protein [Gemmataceae bacterium]